MMMMTCSVISKLQLFLNEERERKSWNFVQRRYRAVKQQQKAKQFITKFYFLLLTETAERRHPNAAMDSRIEWRDLIIYFVDSVV